MAEPSLVEFSWIIELWGLAEQGGRSQKMIQKLGSDSIRMSGSWLFNFQLVG